MKIIYNDELYGEVTYSRMHNAWKKTTPHLLIFNGKECPVTLYIKFSSVMYMETKYGLSKDFKMEELLQETIDRGEKWEQEQRELYIKYLEEPNDFMKRVEDKIVADFQDKRQNGFDDDACVKFFGEKKAKKIIKADTREKILNLVRLKDLTVMHNRIRILGKCELYPNYGISISTEGFISVGLEENVY